MEIKEFFKMLSSLHIEKRMIFVQSKKNIVGTIKEIMPMERSIVIDSGNEIKIDNINVIKQVEDILTVDELIKGLKSNDKSEIVRCQKNIKDYLGNNEDFLLTDKEKKEIILGLIESCNYINAKVYDTALCRESYQCLIYVAHKFKMSMMLWECNNLWNYRVNNDLIVREGMAFVAALLLEGKVKEAELFLRKINKGCLGDAGPRTYVYGRWLWELLIENSIIYEKLNEAEKCVLKWIISDGANDPSIRNFINVMDNGIIDNNIALMANALSLILPYANKKDTWIPEILFYMINYLPKTIENLKRQHHYMDLCLKAATLRNDSKLMFIWNRQMIAMHKYMQLQDIEWEGDKSIINIIFHKSVDNMSLGGKNNLRIFYDKINDVIRRMNGKEKVKNWLLGIATGDWQTFFETLEGKAEELELFDLAEVNSDISFKRGIMFYIISDKGNDKIREALFKKLINNNNNYYCAADYNLMLNNLYDMKKEALQMLKFPLEINHVFSYIAEEMIHKGSLHTCTLLRCTWPYLWFLWDSMPIEDKDDLRYRNPERGNVVNPQGRFIMVCLRYIPIDILYKEADYIAKNMKEEQRWELYDRLGRIFFEKRMDRKAYELFNTAYEILKQLFDVHSQKDYKYIFTDNKYRLKYCSHRRNLITASRAVCGILSKSRECIEEQYDRKTPTIINMVVLLLSSERRKEYDIVFRYFNDLQQRIARCIYLVMNKSNLKEVCNIVREISNQQSEERVSPYHLILYYLDRFTEYCIRNEEESSSGKVSSLEWIEQMKWLRKKLHLDTLDNIMEIDYIRKRYYFKICYAKRLADELDSATINCVDKMENKIIKIGNFNFAEQPEFVQMAMKSEGRTYLNDNKLYEQLCKLDKMQYEKRQELSTELLSRLWKKIQYNDMKMYERDYYYLGCYSLNLAIAILQRIRLVDTDILVIKRSKHLNCLDESVRYINYLRAKYQNAQFIYGMLKEELYWAMTPLQNELLDNVCENYRLHVDNWRIILDCVVNDAYEINVWNKYLGILEQLQDIVNDKNNRMYKNKLQQIRQELENTLAGPGSRYCKAKKPLIRILVNTAERLNSNANLKIKVDSLYYYTREEHGIHGSVYNEGQRTAKEVSLILHLDNTAQTRVYTLKNRIQGIEPGETQPFCAYFPDSLHGDITYNIEVKYSNNSDFGEKIEMKNITEKQHILNEKINSNEIISQITVGEEPADGNDFVGRNKEVRFISNIFAPHKKFKEMPSYIIYGQKRIGKSSLLHKSIEIIRQFHPGEVFISSVVNAQSVNRKTMLYDVFIKRPLNDYKIELKRSARNNPNDINIENKREILENLIDEWKECDIDSNPSLLIDFYHEFFDLISPRGLILPIDEAALVFHKALENYSAKDGGDLFNVLRAILQEQCNEVHFLFCGTDVIANYLIDERLAQFRECIEEISLGAMERYDVETIITKKLDDVKYGAKVDWHLPELKDILWKYGGGYIYHTIKIFNMAIMRAQKYSRNVLYSDDITKAVEMYVTSGEAGSLKNILENCTPLEKNVFALMRKLEAPYKRLIKFDELLLELPKKISKEKLINILYLLENRKLIIITGENVTIASELFRICALNEGYEIGRVPNFERIKE